MRVVTGRATAVAMVIVRPVVITGVCEDVIAIATLCATVPVIRVMKVAMAAMTLYAINLMGSLSLRSQGDGIKSSYLRVGVDPLGQVA